jgi:DNA-binding winged helix-turn-helix (wHTH) protein
MITASARTKPLDFFIVHTSFRLCRPILLSTLPLRSNLAATHTEHSGTHVVRARAGGGPMASDIISIGDIEIRPHEHAVVVSGREVALTPREFEIVMMLAEHPGWVFSASQLADDSGQSEYSPESVSVLVSRLRQKLASAGVVDAVETVRGFGYRLHASTGSDAESVDGSGARRELRDALWQLQEAVIEVEHAGSAEQREAVRGILDASRRAIHSSLAD